MDKVEAVHDASPDLNAPRGRSECRGAARLDLLRNDERERGAETLAAGNHDVILREHSECAEVRALDVLGLTRPVLVDRYEEPLAAEIDAEIVEANRAGLQHVERDSLTTGNGASVCSDDRFRALHRQKVVEDREQHQ